MYACRALRFPPPASILGAHARTRAQTPRAIHLCLWRGPARRPLLYGLLSPNEGTGGGAPPRTRSWQTYGAVEFSSGRARGE
eukprot:scaffold12401_cov133-Isochrysis_galbana.AAC.3